MKALFHVLQFQSRPVVTLAPETFHPTSSRLKELPLFEPPFAQKNSQSSVVSHWDKLAIESPVSCNQISSQFSEGHKSWSSSSMDAFPLTDGLDDVDQEILQPKATDNETSPEEQAIPEPKVQNDDESFTLPPHTCRSKENSDDVSDDSIVEDQAVLQECQTPHETEELPIEQPARDEAGKTCQTVDDRDTPLTKVCSSEVDDPQVTVDQDVDGTDQTQDVPTSPVWVLPSPQTPKKKNRKKRKTSNSAK